METRISLLEKYPWPVNFRDIPREESFLNFEVSCNLQKLWKFLSDSSKLNRALKMQNRVQAEIDGQLYIETKMLGIAQKWIELPWNWVEGQSIVVDRKYLKGFAHFNHSIFYFYEFNNKKYLAIYMGFIPNGLAKYIFKLGLPKVLENIKNLILSLEKEIEEENIDELLKIENESHVNLEVLDYRLSLLVEDQVPKYFCDLIKQFILKSDDFDAFRIKIKLLARLWDISDDDIVKYFLRAVDKKIFTLSWDVICPSCHGPRTKNSKLIDLLKDDECQACRIKFETNFDRAVEVTFNINHDIRIVKEVMFCAAEPFKKAHLKMQWDLLATTSKNISVNLEKGIYNIRKIDSNNEFQIEVSDFGLNELTWGVDYLNEKKVVMSPHFNLNLINKTKENLRVVIEKIVTDPYFLTPKEVFSKFEFRKLFGNESLGAGVQLFLGSQIVLFTDIVSSTKFYVKSGDTLAYNQVRSHFIVIEKIFYEFGGVIIKTIGDAVMATFPDCNSAFMATKNLHQRFNKSMSEFNFTLRVSAHVGKVIGVNQNTGIDYFGNTVNFCAKIQSITDQLELGVSMDFFHQLNPKLMDDCEVVPKVIDISGFDSPQECRVISFDY